MPEKPTQTVSLSEEAREVRKILQDVRQSRLSRSRRKEIVEKIRRGLAKHGSKFLRQVAEKHGQIEVLQSFSALFLGRTKSGKAVLALPHDYI